MISLDNLLNKVANNGASTYGILAAGEWNTLVQAVREIQGCVANDTRLEELYSFINVFNQRLTIAEENGRINTTDINAILSDYLSLSRGGSVDANVSFRRNVQIGSDYTTLLKVRSTAEFLSNVTMSAATINTLTVENMLGNIWFRGQFDASQGGEVLVSTPTTDSQAANKGYVDAANAELTETVTEIQTNQTNDKNAQSFAPFDGFAPAIVSIEHQTTIEFDEVLFSSSLNKFIVKKNRKFYQSWVGMHAYNNPDDEEPYELKPYVYAKGIYMYDKSSGELELVTSRIIGPLTEEEYSELETIDQNAYYAITEE